MPWVSATTQRTDGTRTGNTVWQQAEAAAVDILSADHDAHDQDVADMIALCRHRGGANNPTANLPMAAFRHTGVGNATARNQYAAAGQVQDGSLVWGGTTTGTAPDYVATVTPTGMALTAGVQIGVLIHAANVGKATINVNTLGVKAITKNGAVALDDGDLAADAIAILEYDGTRWQLTNPASTQLARLGKAQTFTKTQTWTKGSDVASATTLSLGDGNSFDITGTTTVTGIATKGVGTAIRLQFDGILTLTHHATDLVLPGGANITTAAGDIAEFEEYATGDWRCTNYQRADGPPFTSASQANMEAETAGKFPDAAVLKFHPAVAKFWCVFNGTVSGPITPSAGYNVVDVTDNGVGDYTVNVDTDFSAANWVPGGTSGRILGGSDALWSFNTLTAGTVRFNTRRNSDNVAGDPSIVAAWGFGDLA